MKILVQIKSFMPPLQQMHHLLFIASNRTIMTIRLSSPLINSREKLSSMIIQTTKGNPPIRLLLWRWMPLVFPHQGHSRCLWTIFISDTLSLMKAIIDGQTLTLDFNSSLDPLTSPNLDFGDWGGFQRNQDCIGWAKIFCGTNFINSENPVDSQSLVTLNYRDLKGRSVFGCSGWWWLWLSND